jgi:hypothetical protein
MKKHFFQSFGIFTLVDYVKADKLARLKELAASGCMRPSLIITDCRQFGSRPSWFTCRCHR